MTENTYLAHHGIKGMKWGVRRTPEQLGHFKPSVSTSKSGRFSVGDVSSVAKNTTSKLQSYREKDLVDKGYSKEEAHKMIEDRKDFMKKLAVGTAIVGGVALTASTAYYLKNKGELECDSIIKAGTTIQTLSADRDRIDKGRAFYTNFVQSDIVTYEGTFGKTRYGFKNAITAQASKDVRVAGYKTGKDVFDRLMKEDAQFREGVKVLMPSGKSFGYKKGYDSFNSTILPLDPKLADDFYPATSRTRQAARVNERFYNALKKAGYGAVEDVNDTRYSNLRGKHPAIVFDRESFGKTSVTTLTAERVSAGRKVASQEIPKIKRMRNINPQNVAMGSAFVASTVIPYAVAGYSAKQTAPRKRQIESDYREKRASINDRISKARNSGNASEVRKLKRELRDVREERDYQRYVLSNGKELADLLYDRR